MTYENLVFYDKPYAFHSLNSEANPRSPLAWGSGTSAQIKGDRLYDFPVFTRKNQPHAFDLWFKSIGEAKVLILGQSGGGGLSYENRKFTYAFPLELADITLEYEVNEDKTYYLAIIYTIDAVSLYVDGVERDTHYFTSDEKASPFKYQTGNMKSAPLTSEFLLDAVGFYLSTPKDMPARHYDWGNFKPDIMKNVSLMTGSTIELTADKLIKEEYLFDWSVSKTDGVSYTSGSLKATDQSGTWIGSLTVQSDSNVVLDSSGGGSYKIEYSFDDINWSSYTEGQLLTVKIITPLSVRITVSTNQSVDLLKAIIYSDQNIKASGLDWIASVGGKSVNPGVFYPTENKPFGANGPVSVSGNESIKAVEFWIKSANSNSITSLAGTKTINGGAGYFPYQWNHVLVEQTTTAPFTVGNSNSTIGMINLYRFVPNASVLYNSYYGPKLLSVFDNGTPTLTDSFKTYSYTWTTITTTF